jgi:hypothetical protein
MRTSTLALFTALPLLASAVPTWSKDDHSSSGWKDDKSASTHHGGSDWLIGDGPFDFTSTYSAWATPDQVYVDVSRSLGMNKQQTDPFSFSSHSVNANSTPTPGEAGAWGSFNYGINVHEEIICYNITFVFFSFSLSPFPYSS